MSGYDPLSELPDQPKSSVPDLTDEQIQAAMLAGIKQVRPHITDPVEAAGMDADIARMEHGLVDLGETGWAVMRAVHRHLRALPHPTEEGPEDQTERWAKALYDTNAFYMHDPDNGWSSMAPNDGGIRDLHMDMARAAKNVWDRADGPKGVAPVAEDIVRTWLDQSEGWGVRRERLAEAVATGVDITPWLVAAASLGLSSRHPLPETLATDEYREALDWVRLNVVYIRRDNGDMEVTLGAVLDAYNAGRASASKNKNDK